MAYNNYLQSDHWQNKRLEKLNYRNVCQICSTSNKLHVHHKFYKTKQGDSILFNEKITNLITFCNSCHSLWHRYFGIGIRKPNKTILRIKRLIELGVKKNKAFWTVANPELYESIYQISVGRVNPSNRHKKRLVDSLIVAK